MRLLKQIDEAIATARYMQTLSAEYAAKVSQDLEAEAVEGDQALAPENSALAA